MFRWRGRRDLQAEARFARPLLQHEVPAGIAAGSFHFVDGEIEAEEKDVVLRAALYKAACGSWIAAGWPPLPQSASRAHASRPTILACWAKITVFGILLEQFAADDEHCLRRGG